MKKTKDDGTIRGELYKGASNGVANRFRDTEPLPTVDTLFWGGFEYEYPDEIAPDWSLIEDFVSFVVYSSDQSFSAEYKDRFNITNAADYYIFMNLLGAVDNRAKNLFIAKYNTGEPYFYVPWDLDATFGNDPLGDPTIGTTDTLTNGIYNRLNLQKENGGYVQVLKARWDALRKSVITVPNLMSLFTQNHDYLLANAVYEREEMVWNYTYDAGKLTEISNWMTDRIAFLDNYFAENFTLSLADLQTPDNPIKMYPNPAVNRVNILLENADLPAEATVYTLAGQRVLKQSLSSSTTSMEVGSLASGIYLVQIQSGVVNETKKLVIKK